MNDLFDITLPNIHIQKILETNVVDKDILNQHLNINDPEIIKFKESNPPKIKVTFSRLEPDISSNVDSDVVSVPVNEDSRIDLVIPPKSDQNKNYYLLPIKSCFLWDLSQFNKADLLRCGRFKKNEFLPIIKDEPLEMDLGVSREHSLICFYKSQMYYLDYGTSVKHFQTDNTIPEKSDSPISHFGSKNGSWLYNSFSISECIKNRYIKWNPNSIIGIGTFFYNVSYKEKTLKLFHQFSFNYEIIA